MEGILFSLFCIASFFLLYLFAPGWKSTSLISFQGCFCLEPVCVFLCLVVYQSWGYLGLKGWMWIQTGPNQSCWGAFLSLPLFFLWMTPWSFSCIVGASINMLRMWCLYACISACQGLKILISCKTMLEISVV